MYYYIQLPIRVEFLLKIVQYYKDYKELYNGH